MEIVKRLIKEIPRGFIISLLIFLVLLIIKAITGNAINFDMYLLSNFGYTILYGLSLYLANAALFIYLDSVYVNERFTKRRIIIGFLSSFLISVGIIFLLRIFEDVIIEGSTFTQFFGNESASNYLVAIITTFIVTLAFHAFHFYKAYNENRVKEQKVIAGTANAKFESLKNQIDPHFLFNSLNVLSSLIEENPENAQRFTTSLSKIYRYVLEQKDKELVTLEEELSFAKTYMNLLKMRFENSISYNLPENFDYPEAKVVPLSLQLLLENTIKHNIVSEQKPLHIKIYLEDNYLIVENNLQKKEVLQDRRGVGLQNIVDRYALISERKVLIEENSNFFKIKIPILTKQVVTMETQSIFNENTAYIKAKERVEKLKGFYGNLISYCCVIPVLIFINLNEGGFQWFWFPMMGWGMGVCFHAFDTFGYGKSWEDKKIQQILNKDNQSNTKWN
jgi:sensor histidine kinase YesM